jgi:hypothetical protein
LSLTEQQKTTQRAIQNQKKLKKRIKTAQRHTTNSKEPFTNQTHQKERNREKKKKEEEEEEEEEEEKKKKKKKKKKKTGNRQNEQKLIHTSTNLNKQTKLE